MGAVVCFGSIYFSAIAPPVDVDALGWAVGAWALAMAVAMLVSAARLPAGDRVRRFAVRLLALHFAFGVVKVAGVRRARGPALHGFDVALIALLRASLARSGPGQQVGQRVDRVRAADAYQPSGQISKCRCAPCASPVLPTLAEPLPGGDPLALGDERSSPAWKCMNA